MARWTLDEAKRRVQMWLDCEESIAVADQSYTVADRTYTRANLKEVRERISYWANEVERLEAGNAPGPVFRKTTIIERPFQR